MGEIDNFYDILEIEPTDDEREIKKAYTKMLRRYPPEKSPEGFQKIREAYENLIDPVFRARYNALSKYQDEIDEYANYAEDAFERKDYKSAIKYYKKILIIEPTLTFAKNGLGIALLNEGEYDLALIEFEELVKLDPTNSIYYNNLAHTYIEKDEYNKAEKVFLKTNKLDPANEDTVLSLSALYLKQNKPDKAIAFLKGCLGRNQYDVYQDFKYYFQMVKIFAHMEDMIQLDNLVDEIRQVALDKDINHEYIATEFGKLAILFYDVKRYDLSEKLSSIALDFNDKEDILQELNDESSELKNFLSSYEILLEDKRILGIIKAPIYIFIYGGDMTEAEYKENLDAMEDIMSNSLVNSFNEIIDSIDMLREDYKLLYNCKKDFYEYVYKIAEENKKSSTRLNQTKKAENKNSCSGTLAIVIICAIIGEILIPVVGGVLGMYVGSKIINSKDK